MLDIVKSRMLTAQSSMLLDMAVLSIGERVRAARERKGWSQAELARRIGVTRSAIAQLESGLTTNPRPQHLFSLAKALDVDARELTYGTPITDLSTEEMVFRLLEAMPPELQQQVFDFTLYQAHRAEKMFVSEKLTSYLAMIDGIKADMASRQKKPAESIPGDGENPMAGPVQADATNHDGPFLQQTPGRQSSDH